MPFDRGASRNSRRHRERLAERPIHRRVTRFRRGKKNGEWKDPKEEVVYLIASLEAGEAAPEALLCANRGHCGIEIMHRNKGVILGEDACTNRSHNAPRNIFSLIGFALKILKSVAPLPTRSIKQFQDDRNKALRLFSGSPSRYFY